MVSMGSIPIFWFEKKSTVQRLPKKNQVGRLSTMVSTLSSGFSSGLYYFLSKWASELPCDASTCSEKEWTEKRWGKQSRESGDHINGLPRIRWSLLRCCVTSYHKYLLYVLLLVCYSYCVILIGTNTLTSGSIETNTPTTCRSFPIHTCAWRSRALRSQCTAFSCGVHNSRNNYL